MVVRWGAKICASISCKWIQGPKTVMLAWPPLSMTYSKICRMMVWSKCFHCSSGGSGPFETEMYRIRSAQFQCVCSKPPDFGPQNDPFHWNSHGEWHLLRSNPPRLGAFSPIVLCPLLVLELLHGRDCRSVFLLRPNLLAFYCKLTSTLPLASSGRSSFAIYFGNKV